MAQRVDLVIEKNGGVLRKLLRLVVLAALFVASGILHPATAKADEAMGPPHPFPKQLSVVQLGDSFSAGNGAGSYYGAAWCERSAKNWGQRFVESANFLGVDATYVNRACSGGVLGDIFKPGTVQEQYLRIARGNSEDDVRARLEQEDACSVKSSDDIIGVEYQINRIGKSSVFTYRCKLTLRPQADSVDKSTDLVLMTMGGNDAGFADIIQHCFVPLGLGKYGGGDGNKCKKDIQDTSGNLSKIMDSLEDAIERLLFEKMSGNPSSQVILMSYPLLSLDKPHLVKTDSGQYDASAAVRELGMKAVEHQKQLVQRLNRKYLGRVKLVEQTPAAFAGHEPDPSFNNWWKGEIANPQRWLNEFLETEGDYGEDNKIKSKFSVTYTNFWHPNIAGHRNMGSLIQSSGVSQNAPLLSGHQSKRDVVFVVDATSSMRDKWSETVASIQMTMLPSIFGGDTRYALVTYQDHPEGGGVAGNYPSRVDQDFTENPGDILNALGKVELAPAGDPAESVYSGIFAGLSLNWRKDASKVMLVLGDGPAKDPEPVTGLTWQSLRLGSYAVSNTQVVPVSDPATIGEGLAHLAEATGGKAIPNSTAGKTPEDVANDVTEESADKPFAWLQGPYVAKVGSEVRLDARASHSPNGGVKKYEWDFDGDGTFDETTTADTVVHRYDKEVSGHVMVRVTDAKGETSVGSTKLDITRDGDVIPDAYDNCPDVANPNQQDIDGNWIGDECEDPEQFLRPPSPSPTPSPSASPTQTVTPSVAPSESPSPTASPSQTVSPTAEPIPSGEPSASPTISEVPSPSPSASGSGGVTVPPDPPQPPSTTPTVSPPTGLPSPTSAPPPSRSPVKPGLPRTGYSAG